MASLLSYYYNRPVEDFLRRTSWNKDDPNVLDLELQGCVQERKMKNNVNKEKNNKRGVCSTQPGMRVTQVNPDVPDLEQEGCVCV